MESVDTVLNSYVHNDFTARVEDGNYQGKYLELVNGINRLGQVMCEILKAQKQLSDDLKENQYLKINLLALFMMLYMIS